MIDQPPVLLRIIYRVGRVPGGTPGLGHIVPNILSSLYKGDSNPERLERSPKPRLLLE